jgi:hypothetical protein
MKLHGHGIRIDLPQGWEGRIYRRPEANPVLHAANFALPPRDGDFGSGAVASMGPDGVFVALAEFLPDLANTGLFAPHGIPVPLPPAAANPKTVQRRLPGRWGIQRFFTEGGRPFTLYLVVGSAPSVDSLVGRANRVLSSLAIEAPST